MRNLWQTVGLSTFVLMVPLLTVGCLKLGPSPKANAKAEEGEGGAPVADEPHQNAMQREAKLVDRNQWLADNPNWNEIEKNVINASDPLTATAQGYFAAGSQLTIVALKHDLEIWKNMPGNDGEKYPDLRRIRSHFEECGRQAEGPQEKSGVRLRRPDRKYHDP